MQPPKRVHVSFDDVYFYSKDDCESFLGSLKLYHNLYGAKFSLYTFEIPVDVKRDTRIEQNSDWLKFSYHGSVQPFDSTASSNSYTATLAEQLELLRRLGGDSCLTNTVRLHYFYADTLMIREALNKGITTFLAADTHGRKSYTLDSRMSDSLYSSGALIEMDKKFYRTDIRLESTSLYDCLTNGNLSDPALVIFTHKDKFGRLGKIKMHILMAFLWLNNYEYVTEL